MARLYSLQEAANERLLGGCACAFGVFDGLHRGHAHLLGLATELAAKQQLPSVVLTFDIDPDELFAPGRLRKLQSNESRLAALALSGVDAVCVLPFTRQFAALDPQAFLDTVFKPEAPAHLFTGVDFRFGARAAGTVETMQDWARSSSQPMQVHPCPLLEVDGSPVTATRIRTLLAEANLEQANMLLGNPYELEGKVLEGRHDGRKLGFPTANLEVEPQMHVLAEGVYAAYAQVDDKVWRAAASVGRSPLFESAGAASLEVHLLDFDGNLYGQNLRVRFYRRLRPMVAFQNVEELARTVQDNIAWVRDNMPKEEPGA